MVASATTFRGITSMAVGVIIQDQLRSSCSICGGSFNPQAQAVWGYEDMLKRPAPAATG